MVRHPYRRAVYLCSIAELRWDELDAAYYQINLAAQKPARFVGLVYAWAVANMDNEQREKFDVSLTDLLPWEDAQSDAAVELESASFMQMMANSG